MAVKNLVSGVLAQSITTSTTNVLVNIAENIDASGIQSFFPTPPFYITIMPKTPAVGVANRLDSEILQVTAVGGDQSGNASLTCVRGQRDTTAKAFDVGSIVTVGVYAEDAVLLGSEGSTNSTTAYEKRLVDKNGNTIVPITGYMGKIYTATLSTATAGGTANYDFTPDTPIENNRVYAVIFPTPTVNNATVILGDGVSSGSILVPPVAATDSPNYELLNTDMINDTEPLLLMYNGVQWVCLNQKKKVDTADLNDDSVTSNKIDWAALYKSATPLSSTLPVQAQKETAVQSFTLPAGKWRIFWAVRGYGDYHQADITFAGLKANRVKVQSLGVNDATTGTLRPYISCSYEANITSSTAFSTYVTMVMAGNVSAETTFLFALRVG